MSEIELLKRIEVLQRRVEALETIDRAPIVARYSTNAGQSIGDSAWPVINFEDQVYDPYGLVTVGASWKFTAPIGGYYLVTEMISFAASVSNAIVGLQINGSTYCYLNRGSIRWLPGSTVVYMAADDYLWIRLGHFTGSSVALDSNSTYNHITISRVTP